MVRLTPLAAALLLSLALAACGGGGGNDQPILTPQPAMAKAGFERFNENRTLMGLNLVVRNLKIDTAAQGHSDYQARNDVITHDQVQENPGFTGIDLLERLNHAQYQFTPGKDSAFGEVISRTGHTNGVAAADALIAAIYHRFVIFEPMFKEAGVGATTAMNGSTYFTTDFAANNGLDQGLGAGNFAVYPVNGQKNVPVDFSSDSERPDPVPELGKNVVGYPISVHADITQCITTTAFTVSTGGTPLATRLLTFDDDIRPVSDPDQHPTPRSAAAIIPLSRLEANTVYEVTFSGNISASINLNQPSLGCVGNGPAITHQWSFTTR